MPVVRDPAQFDRKSGSRLEQLVFNNRLLVLLLCLAATAVLGYFALKLEVNASFERMIPSSSPYIQTYFAYREELPGWETQCGSSWRTRAVMSTTQPIWKNCARSMMHFT